MTRPMTRPITLPDLHTFDEIAALLDIPVRRLLDRAYGPNPQITHIHIGRERYMTDAQLAAFLESRTKAASAKPKSKGGRPRGRKNRAAQTT